MILKLPEPSTDSFSNDPFIHQAYAWYDYKEHMCDYHVPNFEILFE